MSNFWQRTLTGTLFVIVIMVSVLWSKYAFISLIFVIGVLALWEYTSLFKGRRYKPDFIATMLSGGGIAAIWGLEYAGINNTLLQSYFTGVFWGSLSLPLVLELVLTKKPSFKNIGLGYAGVLYINTGFYCFAALGNNTFQNCLNPKSYFPLHIIGFLVLLWSSDTFAYLTGRAFGKTPLAPKISPKKTWEGSIGGGICTVAVSIILFKYIGYFDLLQWVILAIIIVVFGIIGDLIESRFKRTLNVKDSGHILPGHGGILDRFDSLLLAAPVSVIFLWLTEMFAF